MLRTALAMAVVLVVSPAAAQMLPPAPPRLDSLDRPVLNATVVATGSVTDVQASGGGTTRWTITIVVDETLKGVHQERIRVPVVAAGDVVETWRRTSALLLVAVPSGTGPSSIIDLSDGELAVMTADLTLVRTPEEVIREAREIIARDRGGNALEWFGVPIEAATVAGTSLDPRRGRKSADASTQPPPGGVVFVDVPVDERLERLAREELQSPVTAVRINGAQALRHFASPQNIALLTPLLDDDGWEDSYSGQLMDDNALRRIQYNNVRREAYRTLQQLGAAVVEPESLRPQNRDEQVISVALDARAALPTDISTLARYPNLEDLYLSTQRLTDDQWTAIGRLQSLRTLFLEGSNISDSTLERLAGLANLVYIGLGNTEVTDRGVLTLARFKALRKVDLGLRVTPGGVSALARVRPDIRARLDEFAFLARLNPRRVERPFVEMRNSLLPVGDANPEARGLRCYALVFPKEAAGQVDELLTRELPPRGWTRVTWPGYRRESGVPITSRAGWRHLVDELFTNDTYKSPWIDDWPPFVRPGPGERVITIAWNVNPKN